MIASILPDIVDSIIISNTLPTDRNQGNAFGGLGGRRSRIHNGGKKTSISLQVRSLLQIQMIMKSRLLRIFMA